MRARQETTSMFTDVKQCLTNIKSQKSTRTYTQTLTRTHSWQPVWQPKQSSACVCWGACVIGGETARDSRNAFPGVNADVVVAVRGTHIHMCCRARHTHTHVRHAGLAESRVEIRRSNVSPTNANRQGRRKAGRRRLHLLSTVES